MVMVPDSGRLPIVIKPPERQFNKLALRLSLDED